MHGVSWWCEKAARGSGKGWLHATPKTETRIILDDICLLKRLRPAAPGASSKASGLHLQCLAVVSAPQALAAMRLACGAIVGLLDFWSFDA
ncbi:hypothetical protein ABFV80_002808 [Vandammella animalimorsus]|uniref:hypothetical protein n=1 Tax=Vandammella animalimorsus TaxID=2029117 RepID=UPI00325BD49B